MADSELMKEEGCLFVFVASTSVHERVNGKVGFFEEFGDFCAFFDDEVVLEHFDDVHVKVAI